MQKNLEKYLHDHLAGAAFAIDLAQALCRKHEADEEAADFNALAAEIEEDRDELVRIVEALGLDPGGLKESVTRILEKLSRPKLVSSREDVFSTFEACETLGLGILGKRALWEALATTSVARSQIDFQRLRDRAEKQHTIAERLRLTFARRCFR
jgi:hypothetical protein